MFEAFNNYILRYSANGKDINVLNVLYFYML